MEAQRGRPGLGRPGPGGRAATAPAALVALVLVALAAAGCGGSDGPTRAEYAAQANRVCGDIIASSEQLGKLRPDGVREVVGVIDRLQRTVQGGVARLRALPRPAGEDGRTATAFVQAFEGEFRTGVLPALSAMRRAARARDVAALRRAVARLQRVDTSRSKGLARKLGATRCSS